MLKTRCTGGSGLVQEQAASGDDLTGGNRMILSRLIHSVRLAVARGGRGRADYLRKKNLLGHVGTDVSFQPRRLPLYSELIRLHDNVGIARNVDFCTHDIMHGVFNRYISSTRGPAAKPLRERVGCIEIGANSFIGSNVVLIYGARVGENVVVASGSVVTGELEPGAVYAGAPAKRVGTYEELVERYVADQAAGRMPTVARGQRITPDEIAHAWQLFDEKSTSRR